MRVVIKILVLVIFLVSSSLNNRSKAQGSAVDTLIIDSSKIQKQEVFYDSLKYRASRKKLTRLIYDFLITPPRPYVDHKTITLEYYSQFKGKLISELQIKSLDVFGPSFEDTSRVATSRIEKAANVLHTKSNLKTIQKLLLFKVGDFVDPELVYENARIIRSLPYINDIKVYFEQDTLYEGLVKVLILTKDRFSFGVAGAIGGVDSGELEIYNQNIFGVGHQIAIRFVGNYNKQPYAGLETYYRINNINGKFINITTAYLNHYKREGYIFNLNKPFITPSVKWGYGSTALRFFRTNQIFEDDPVNSDSLNLNLHYLSAWAGRSFHINTKNNNSTQMVISGAFYNRYYYQRPPPDIDNNQYFSNSTFYLASITFSQRQYVQDQLVYSYGITEDIPEGFKNEIVYGFDANEFGNRHYAHLLLTNGNKLKNKGYIFVTSGIGGYFNSMRYEQGQIDASLNYISKQINAGRKRFRFFTNIRYTLGLRRFEIEKLTLNIDDHIRGFASADEHALGQQRLSLNLEYVLFLRKQFYQFNLALYGFADVGIIGPSNDFILSQNYFSGIGAGLRVHNENLVFKTFYLRFAFYPFPPRDMSYFGFLLNEQSKRRYTSFEPVAPEPFVFK